MIQLDLFLPFCVLKLKNSYIKKFCEPMLNKMKIKVDLIRLIYFPVRIEISESSDVRYCK